MIPDNIHRKAFRPQWWQDIVVPYMRRHTARRVSQTLYSPPSPQRSLMEEDWDNAIILDACRYDMFEAENTIEGELSHRYSVGSATREFLTRTFTDSQHHDTVYVTANPMHRVVGLEDVFHDVIDVWADHWDEEQKTVLPEDMARETARAAERYPNKRILSQFMQPHYPFIGELADKIGEQCGYKFMLSWMTDEGEQRESKTVWELVEDGEVSHDLVRDAYYENLAVALPHVQTLLDNLTGQSVVTSDHGNLLGERPFPLARPNYGHPVRVHCDELCKVPWLVPEAETRKRIVEEPPTETSSEREDVVSDRLADLGYVDP